MMKSMISLTLNMYPILINIMILTTLMIPLKTNKFHPMILLMMLIMNTFMISLKMNLLFYSWLPYLLFLMMIGGLLIIYLYITSLSNNELFYLNLMKFNIKKIIVLMSFFLIMYINNKYFMNLQDLWNNYYNIMYNQLNISIIYQKMNNKMSYFMMWYLYYSMICMMNICYKNKIPLRQLNI